MLDKILEYAKSKHVRICAMNGSRVNPNVEKDDYQDYDIVFFVDSVEEFVIEPEVFGEILISQDPKDDNDFKMLMTQYMDGNRIDLEIRPVSNFEEYLKEDSLTQVLFNYTDTDIYVVPNDSMHRLRNPTQEVLDDAVNEMYWVSLYVIKAVKRNQINYATHLMTNIILDSLSLMLAWNINIKYDTEINYGLDYKYISKYLDDEGRKYFFDLYRHKNILENLVAALIWYDTLLDNVVDFFEFEKPDYHNRILEYITKEHV